MYKIISEATIIGIITFILGKMIIDLVLDKKIKNNKKHPKGVHLAFFFTGFLLHFLIEYLGLNCWYCDKKCMVRVKRFL